MGIWAKLSRVAEGLRQVAMLGDGPNRESPTALIYMYVRREVVRSRGYPASVHRNYCMTLKNNRVFSPKYYASC